MRRRSLLLVVPTTAVLLTGIAAPAALAATDGVVHRESVLTELDATGTAGTSRVFTQITVPEGGDAVLDGQSVAGLRTLTGAGPDEDGDALLFGQGFTRTVADNTAALPVEVEVRYAIDGRQVEPGDVTGHDGEVAVTYVVRNVTAEPTELTVVDGDGVPTTETVDVAVPLVGSLSLTLPSGFRDVVAPGAVVVGDGRGATVVNWSLLLFAPLGAEEQEVTWTAQATDALVPDTSLQVIPVTPGSFGSLGSTEAAYGGAVDSTTELTGGAREIDENLRRLAEGADELLAGLTQLRDGADTLATGLEDARAGSTQLADGLGQARDGSLELRDGLSELADGSITLAAGLGTADDGAGDLADGLTTLADGSSTLAAGLAALDSGAFRLVDGIGQLATGSSTLAGGADDLADGAGLLDANTATLAAGAADLSSGASQLQSGVQQLSSQLQGADGLPRALAGIDQLQVGIGAEGTPDTLLDGLARVRDGLAQASAGIEDPADPRSSATLRGGVAQLGGGVSNPACNPADPADPTNPCGVQQLNGSIGSLSTALLADLQAVLADLGSIDPSALSPADQATLDAALDALAGDATTAGTIQATSAGISTVVGQLQGGLAQVDAGLVTLSGAIGDPATADTLRNGVARITAGVSNPLCDPTDPTNAANPCGVLEGLGALEVGLTDAATQVAAGLGSVGTPGTLLWGADQVATGSSTLSAGAGRLRTEGTAPLAAGADQLRDGAQQVAAGASTADAGAGELGDGAGQLADGSLTLRDGAARAETGAGDLAEGLARLEAGGRDLSAGAQRAVGGAADLGEGLVQLDDGGRQLADGLVDAADGGRQLADGLVDAGDGGQQIGDGSQQLVDEGTSVLADTVSDATVSSSLQLEQVRAVAARGVAGDGLSYPTVDDADASAVYQFELAGTGDPSGPGVPGRVGLGLLGLLLAAAIGVVGAGMRPGVGRERDIGV